MTLLYQKEADVEFWQERLREVYGGRRWIVAMDVLMSTPGVARALEALGAEAVLCIGATRGVGEAEFSTEPVVVASQAGGGASMMGSIRASLDLLASVGEDVQARVDAFDPEGTARVIGPIFDDGRPVAGRAKFGARSQMWQRLEDKTAVDRLWEEVGVKTAPWEVVESGDEEALWGAHERLDEGLGTVWSGDMSEGFNGGGEYVRWVRGREEEAPAFFGERTRRVRVMPFVEGIPCSVHGVVLEEGVAALRPCEMLVFRRPGSAKLRYASTATAWDPPPERRAEMREAARRVGEHLRERYGYRGVFTMDGVMGRQGFVPTELNPRYGAALGHIEAAVGLPLMLLNLAWAEGVEGPWRLAELEEAMVEAADERRGGRVMAMVPQEVEEERVAWLRRRGDGWEEVEEEDAEVRVRVGPRGEGGIVLGSFVSERLESGPSLAPAAIALLGWVERSWGVEIGALAPAQDIR